MSTIAFVLTITVALLVGDSQRAEAVTKCTARINTKTGALEIEATGVGANARWGTHAGFNPATEGAAFTDEATCCAAGKCKKCHLGAPGTLAERTHPATCNVCVSELSGGTECCAYPEGCITGIRLRDGSFATNDPRFESIQAVGGNTLRFTAVNVQVVDGSGNTGGATNGLGNVIVGYNEDASGGGSHNLVIGAHHTYSSYGGLVAGTTNSIEAPYASVSGGAANRAAGTYASVSGGSFNAATNIGASVSGGRTNLASGESASISGGGGNVASGFACAVSGGANNLAEYSISSVSGGIHNTASGQGASVSGGARNSAAGYTSAVAGGDSNAANGVSATVHGGASNIASEVYASVSGGAFNMASANSASVSGGIGNVASGIESSVSGGYGNSATGDYSSVSGGFLVTENSQQGWSAGSSGPASGPGRFFSH